MNADNTYPCPWANASECRADTARGGQEGCSDGSHPPLEMPSEAALAFADRALGRVPIAVFARARLAVAVEADRLLGPMRTARDVIRSALEADCPVDCPWCASDGSRVIDADSVDDHSEDCEGVAAYEALNRALEGESDG